MSGQSEKSRSAFTLIEVLVVIGVIALLVAILMPSLARSRENARAVVCRTQLNQWGKAMIMYADEFNRCLPFEERPGTRPNRSGIIEDADGDRIWDEKGWICWYDCLDRQLGETNARLPERGVRADDRDVSGIKACPTVRRSDPMAEESYRMNSKLADYSETKLDGSDNPFYMPYRKIDTLDRPSETVLLFGARVGTGGDPNAEPSFKGRWEWTGGDVQYRHVGKTNLLFIDGHVEEIRKKTLDRKSYGNQPVIWQPEDMGEWNPDPPDV